MSSYPKILLRRGEMGRSVGPESTERVFLGRKIVLNS